MYTLIATINYRTDEKDFTIPNLTLAALNDYIRKTLADETTATSFVFTVATQALAERR